MSSIQHRRTEVATGTSIVERLDSGILIGVDRGGCCTSCQIARAFRPRLLLVIPTANYPVSARSVLAIDGAMVGEPLAVELIP